MSLRFISPVQNCPLKSRIIYSISPPAYQISISHLIFVKPKQYCQHFCLLLYIYRCKTKQNYDCQVSPQKTKFKSLIPFKANITYLLFQPYTVPQFSDFWCLHFQTLSQILLLVEIRSQLSPPSCQLPLLHFCYIFQNFIDVSHLLCSYELIIPSLSLKWWKDTRKSSICHT